MAGERARILPVWHITSSQAFERLVARLHVCVRSTLLSEVALPAGVSRCSSCLA